MDAKEILARVGEELNVRRVFGDPIERDGTLIVPAAVVAGGGGGGIDPNASTRTRGDADPGASTTDGGGSEPRSEAMGAGYGGYVRALGVYEIRGGSARFIPALNATALVVAGVVSVAAVLTARALRSGAR